MDELSCFVEKLKSICTDSKNLSVDEARQVVSKINEFLYTNYDGIGQTTAIGETFTYFSDFHKYWESHYKEILDVKINEENCAKTADKLHEVFLLTGGKAFKEVYDTKSLSNEDIARIRFLTANQDFRGSRSFSDFADIFQQDNGIFDEEVIHDNPESFLKAIKIGSLSQNDKRLTYASRVSEFLIQHQIEPIDLPKSFDNDLIKFKTAIINYKGAGYGNKKADMFIRDMVVLGIWKEYSGFDKIDVASDINTIKVALRTGIIQTAIPLVSSFLDIFCYQYGHIDYMNAKAWRRVWEIWQDKYLDETIESPCLMDYFVYNVVGRQFCKEMLYEYQCEKKTHTFKWHSPQNKRCQICYKNGDKNIGAKIVRRIMPCSDDLGYIAIQNTGFVKSLPDDKKITECPFKEICDQNGNKFLNPPKSISIKGRTGWTDAYAKRGAGGGGLMA